MFFKVLLNIIFLLNSPVCEGDALGSRKVEGEDYKFWYRAWIHFGRQKTTPEKPGSGDFP